MEKGREKDDAWKRQLLKEVRLFVLDMDGTFLDFGAA